MRWIFAFLFLISSSFSQGPETLTFSYRDLNGREGKFPIHGKQVLLSFLNKESSSVLEKWLGSLPLEELKRRQIVFLNILFPGGIFFMIPKKKARYSLGIKVNQEVANYLKFSSEVEREIYDSLDIRWVPDFDRKIFGQFGLNSKQSHFLLFNETGTIQGIYEGFTHMQKVDFLSKLSSRKEKKQETSVKSQNKLSTE
jgi:hypothetical protein